MDTDTLPLRTHNGTEHKVSTGKRVEQTDKPQPFSPYSRSAMTQNRPTTAHQPVAALGPNPPVCLPPKIVAKLDPGACVTDTRFNPSPPWFGSRKEPDA